MVFLFNFRKLKNCLPAMIRSLLFVLGFHKIRIKGKLASPSEAPLTVIAPHSSFLDILLLCEYGSAPSGVSKIENLQIPILGCKSVSVITIILVVFTIGRSVRLKSCYVVLNQKCVWKGLSKSQVTLLCILLNQSILFMLHGKIVFSKPEVKKIGSM